MSRNGSGTYILPAGNPVVTGTTISSTTHNNTMSDIATALSGSISADGQTPITANLPMNNKKFTGMAAGTALTDSLTLGQAQAQAFAWCGVAGGTANALTLTPSPAITAYAAGQTFRFQAGASPNSGATTVAISGLATIAVQVNGSACVGAEIAASKWYEIVVDASATACQLFKVGRNTLTELGAAASGANSDITSVGAITGVTATAGDNSTKVATTAFVNTNGTPIGTIIDFAGTAAPANYLACPTASGGGQVVSRTTYAALFAVIGTTWGVGDGSTTFGIPWFAADYSSVQANANVGSATVGAAIAHTHAVPSSANGTSGGSGMTVLTGGGTTITTVQTPTGNAANLPAGVRVLKCVKYQ